MKKMILSRAIAEKSNLELEIKQEIGNTGKKSDPLFVAFVDKDRPFIGAKSEDVFAEQAKAKFQSINDKVRRWRKICLALNKANGTVTLEIPAFKYLDDLNATVGETETMTISQAINMKSWLISHYQNIFDNLSTKYKTDLDAKNDMQYNIDNVVEDELRKKFPAETGKNWSDSKYTESKLELQKRHELIIIDPNNLIKSNAIEKHRKIIQNFLKEIDIALSVANATNYIEIE